MAKNIKTGDYLALSSNEQVTIRVIALDQLGAIVEAFPLATSIEVLWKQRRKTAFRIGPSVLRKLFTRVDPPHGQSRKLPKVLDPLGTIYPSRDIVELLMRRGYKDYVDIE